jgi:hypothetical protein
MHLAPKFDMNCACLVQGWKLCAHAQNSCANAHARQNNRCPCGVVVKIVRSKRKLLLWDSFSQNSPDVSFRVMRLAALELCPYGQMDWTILFGMPRCERAWLCRWNRTSYAVSTCSSIQEIHRILWELEVYYRVKKKPPTYSCFKQD